MKPRRCVSLRAHDSALSPRFFKLPYNSTYKGPTLPGFSPDPSYILHLNYTCNHAFFCAS